jgi:hypothetical protein
LQQSVFSVSSSAHSQQAFKHRHFQTSLILKCSERLSSVWNGHRLSQRFAQWKSFAATCRQIAFRGLAVFRLGALRAKWQLVNLFFRRWKDRLDCWKGWLDRVQRGRCDVLNLWSNWRLKISMSAFSRWKTMASSVANEARQAIENQKLMRKVVKRMSYALLYKAFNRFKTRWCFPTHLLT